MRRCPDQPGIAIFLDQLLSSQWHFVKSSDKMGRKLRVTKGFGRHI